MRPAYFNYTPPRKVSGGYHSSELSREFVPAAPQGLLKVIVKNELIGATWESETAVSTFLPFNSDVVQNVVSRLISYRSDVFPGTSKRKSGTWPQVGLENEYYNPFALLLSKALEAARKELGSGSGGYYYEKIQFSVYDHQVEGSVDQSHPFEHILVGCDKIICPREKLHWRAIMVPITVKRSWQELVEQALHGLTSSPPAQLNTEKGWMHFIEGIVGLASVKDRSGAGMETSRDTSSYHLPWFGLCKIEELHCARKWVCGNATYVSRVKPIRYDVRSNNSSLVCNNSLPELAGTPLCNSLIVKDSWPKRSQNNEATLLKAVGGLFGLPAMYGSYIVKRPDGEDETTATFIPEDAKYWHPWEDMQPKEDPKPELREHVRLMFESEGKPLSQASSPRELLEAILHAIVGYLNMFQMGWMHQDVSIGNVLLLKTRRERPAFVADPKYASVYFELLSRWVDCIAILTDGDNAILWRDRGRARVGRPSGTLPFLSVRLTRAWLLDQPFVRSPIDDLESFIWVLIWASLEISGLHGELTSIDKSYLNGLQSSDLHMQSEVKDLIRARLLFPEALEHTPSHIMRAFQPVIVEWFRIRHEAQLEATPMLDKADTDDLCETTYKYLGKFIAAGHSQLDGLPGSWGEIFESGSK
ncbi:hypothetical protein BD410DRAFT_893123 [Rickenella mellea]|uniref:Fungal-type protein kinase domain-containing protein n=1 Tax=Rickenella mellea TaxID=50990 RepID=A0A4R5XGI4_9AGAM|nr:hypothetical protein BD410DRAFT_893123 [Rickenella mellea]